MLFDPHLSRTESLCIRLTVCMEQHIVVSFGQEQNIQRTAPEEIGTFWSDALAPTTLETTRRRPFLQVFRKGRLPALASPL